MAPSYRHLDALNRRLSNEKAYLTNAKRPQEIELRKVWIAQIEKEIDRECEKLGRASGDMTDDELMAELLREY